MTFLESGDMESNDCPNGDSCTRGPKYVCINGTVAEVMGCERNKTENSGERQNQRGRRGGRRGQGRRRPNIGEDGEDEGTDTDFQQGPSQGGQRESFGQRHNNREGNVGGRHQRFRRQADDTEGDEASERDERIHRFGRRGRKCHGLQVCMEKFSNGTENNRDCPEGSTCSTEVYQGAQEGNVSTLQFCVTGDSICPSKPEEEEDDGEEPDLPRGRRWGRGHRGPKRKRPAPCQVTFLESGDVVSNDCPSGALCTRGPKYDCVNGTVAEVMSCERGEPRNEAATDGERQQRQGGGRGRGRGSGKGRGKGRPGIDGFDDAEGTDAEGGMDLP